MSTCSTRPAFAPRTATGPVSMWPGTMRRVLALWIAGSAGGILNGGPGSTSGGPDTVPSVTTSPLSMVATGASAASK